MRRLLALVATALGLISLMAFTVMASGLVAPEPTASFIAGLSPPSSEITIIQTDTPSLVAAAGTVLLMATSMLFLLAMVAPHRRYEKYVDRMKASFAMAAFARHVIVIPRVLHHSGTIALERITDLPKRLVAAIQNRRTEFDTRYARTGPEFAVDLN